MNIFDAMLEMREIALADGRTPRRWEINPAGIDALISDSRMPQHDMRRDLLGKPFLGIPLTNMPAGPRQRSADPKVDLIVDEITRRR
jgi:hypothetical protein